MFQNPTIDSVAYTAALLNESYQSKQNKIVLLLDFVAEPACVRQKATMTTDINLYDRRLYPLDNLAEVFLHLERVIDIHT